MKVKTSGAEWTSFLASSRWKDQSAYIEEVSIVVDGSVFENDIPDTYKDEARITILRGLIALQQDEQSVVFVTLSSFFKKWKQQQNTDIFLVSAPKEKIAFLRELIKQHGGKI